MGKDIWKLSRYVGGPFNLLNDGTYMCMQYYIRLQITAGHWPLSEQISEVATQNVDQLGLHCMDGLPNEC